MGKWRVPNYILGVYGDDTYVYHSSSNVWLCLQITFYIGFMGFIGLCFTDFEIWNLDVPSKVVLSIALILSYCIWAILFRISFFYRDRMIVLFPFRPWRRTETFFYSDIESFTWEGGEENALIINLKEGSKERRQYVRRWCTTSTVFWCSKRRRRFYFILKFLYDRGCPTTFQIKGDTSDYFARRFNAVFAPEGSRPPRPRHATLEESKLEWVTAILIVFIPTLFILFIFLLTYLHQR